MNKKEVAELKKRYKKEQASFTKLAGCYVDADKKVVSKWNSKFLNLDDEEFFKYLDIAKKSLSGTMGNNLLTLEFSEEGTKMTDIQKVLMSIIDSELKDDGCLEPLYEHIISTYDYAGNYLILVYHDVYDVPIKTSDNMKLDDSDTVYSHIIVSICPVDLSKPALGFNESEKKIKARKRDWVVGAPDHAFIFPDFDNRSANIHQTTYYMKNAKEPSATFMEDVIQCGSKRTVDEKRTAFESMVSHNVLEENKTDVIYSIERKISERIDEYKTVHPVDEVMVLEREELKEILQEENLSNVTSILDSYDNYFGAAGNEAVELVNKSVIEPELPKTTVAIDKELSKQVQVKVIDGVEYVLIPTIKPVVVNGVKVNQ